MRGLQRIVTRIIQDACQRRIRSPKAISQGCCVIATNICLRVGRHPGTARISTADVHGCSRRIFSPAGLLSNHRDIRSPIRKVTDPERPDMRKRAPLRTNSLCGEGTPCGTVILNLSQTSRSGNENIRSQTHGCRNGGRRIGNRYGTRQSTRGTQQHCRFLPIHRGIITCRPTPKPKQSRRSRKGELLIKISLVKIRQEMYPCTGAMPA